VSVINIKLIPSIRRDFLPDNYFAVVSARSENHSKFRMSPAHLPNWSLVPVRFFYILSEDYLFLPFKIRCVFPDLPIKFKNFYGSVTGSCGEPLAVVIRLGRVL